MRNKKCILIILIGIALFAILSINKKTYATDSDKIESFKITVDPRMEDGSLDITYEVKWKVLDTSQEGPLEWVQIGAPNEYFDKVTALSSNISRIGQYNGSYVKIIFTQPYEEGETVTFKYSIHQPYMYKLSGSKCKYEFTPAWFPECKVDAVTIRWNKDKVKKSNTKIVEDNYLVWTKGNLEKGEKVHAEVTYKKKAFAYLDKNKQISNLSSNTSSGSTRVIVCIVVIVVLALFYLGFKIGLGLSDDGYYSHSGFGTADFDDVADSSSYSSSDSGSSSSSGGGSSSSCACACACAGSGRAGCSKKDFYGTNLRSDKIKNVFKK